MTTLTPIARLSLGLVLLTTSILLISDLLGLTPDERLAALNARKTIAETLAVQLSSQVGKDETDTVVSTLRAVTERNEGVLSTGLRKQGRGLLATAGPHEESWDSRIAEKSTSTHVQVPIFKGNDQWGTVEIRFKALRNNSPSEIFGNSFLGLVIFAAVCGYFFYMLFLKKALKELNPANVIPDRVRSALDVLAEGLLILDEKERIVLANTAFAKIMGQTADALVGKRASNLGWEGLRGDSDEFPWLRTIRSSQAAMGTQMNLRAGGRAVYTFNVNTTPIRSPEGKSRGVLATFDDVTLLERKNSELNETLQQLKQTQREITRQNQELQVLATRDPLTGVLNRRSLFEGFKTLFTEAVEDGTPLSCIMVDIDHFKSINDRYGHSTGDKVIKMLAGVLVETSRSSDLVGRYGGEEFCIVLPGVPAEEAVEAAERMRIAVHEGKGGRFTSAVRITSSFGVGAYEEGVADPAEMVRRADMALYVAKESGRNRVVGWNDSYREDESIEESPSGGEGVAESESDAGAGSAVVASGASTTAEALPMDNVASSESNNEAAHFWKKKAEALEVALKESSEVRTEEDSVDALTGLPSRALLYDRINQSVERARRYGLQVAVLVLDLDVAQKINDTLGHAVAEKLIRAAAIKLRHLLRKTDTVAVMGQDEVTLTVSRISMDEFAILLTDISRVESVTWVVKRIFNSLSDPITIEGHEIYVGTTVGISLFPVDGDKADSLVANAGAAMREAKGSHGTNRYRYYSDEINEKSKRHLRLVSQLHRAVQNGQFLLNYQPKIDLHTGTVNGMEALLRWQHPQYGVIQPNDFIPLAEHIGLIDTVGDWVMRSACEQVMAWSNMGLPKIPMAVNLSALQFRDRTLVQRMIQVIDETGVNPNSIELEITETMVMENLDTAVDIMEELHEAGIRISIDDFGTGYSSLNYLRRFPLDKLKIDRSFLTDFTRNQYDAAIVSAIISMAHSLGLRVVAEGVETEEQLKFLRDLQCDEIQGFLISQPVSADAATDLLKSHSTIKRRLNLGGSARGDAPYSRGQRTATDVTGLINDVRAYDGERRVVDPRIVRAG